MIYSKVKKVHVEYWDTGNSTTINFSKESNAEIFVKSEYRIELEDV